MSVGRDGAAQPSLPEPLLAPGDFIAGYPIRKLLGRGGQSEIYEGYDLRNERLVAIKVLLFKHQINPEMRRRAKAEAELEMRLDHPNIVKVYAAGVDEAKKLFYTVMELLDGETLDERLAREGRLDVPETLRIASEVVDGLALIHERKVIHRDIKPENIFLTKDGRVVVIDLGIAKLDGKDFSAIRTDANILLGTLAYMSPEQISHKAAVDRRTDLYALGLVMFKCLTGVHPAWNHHEHPQPPDAREYAAWHLSVVPPLASDVRPDVPTNVAALIARALEKDPQRRPETAAAFGALIDEVAAWVEKNPPPKRAPLPKRPLPRPGTVSPSEIWRPLGAATTQEDEGNDGPTAAAAVPVRLRGPVVATLVAPAPAEPVRTTTCGTAIIEASTVVPALPPPRASAPSFPSFQAPHDMAKTATGTDIVSRDDVVGPALPFVAPPAPLPVPPPALVPPPAPRPTEGVRGLAEAVTAPPQAAPASVTDVLPALTAPEKETAADPPTRAEPAPQRAPGAAPVAAAPAPVAEARRDAGGTVTRTTSGHLMSIPPPAERPAYPRAGWLVAAIAGALCGIVFLFLRAPQPEVQATPDAGPLPVLVELPDAQAQEVDAGGEIADAAAVAELPDAGAPGDVLDAAADAAGPGASSTDGGAKGAGSGKTAKGAGKQIIRGSKHNYWMDDDGYIHRLDPPPPPGPAKPAAAPAEPPAAPPKASAAPAQPPPAPTPTFVLPFGRVED